MNALKPGQLYEWIFDVKDGSWPLTIVTEQARLSVVHSDIIFIKFHDTFIIVSPKDAGPLQLFEYDPAGTVPVIRKFCIIMFKSTLCWMPLEFFDNTITRLIEDV